MKAVLKIMEKINGKAKRDNNPWYNQLDKDCQDLINNPDQSSDKIQRVVGQIGLMSLWIRENSVTRSECKDRHRAWINWRDVAIALPGIAAVVGILLQIFGVV